MRRWLGWISLLLAAVLTTGCKNDTTVITIVEQPEQAYTEETYPVTGYYAPESTDVYYGDIAPAPPDMTQAWTESAQSASPETQQPSTPATNQADMTFGVVIGEGAVVNPLRCVYTDLYSINALVFESLVELDENMQPQPLLADRWTVSGNVWTFTLRSGIQFHNGQPLTAQDVLASYYEALNNPSTHWYELVSQIAGMEIVDDLTIRVKSKDLGYMFLYCMTFPIVQRDTIDYALPRGTGPYWYISYDSSTLLRIERNPLWWKRPSDTVNSVNAVCYKTTQAALVGLELGEIDALATDYPTASLNRSLSDRMTRDYSTLTYECIVPNLRNTILSDISVRQALMYAIDRSGLANTIYAGMVQESEVPVVPGSWVYDPQATRYNYSPERALQLLYESGWSDVDHNGVLEKEINGKLRPLALSLFTYDRGATATRSEAAEAIARQLALVGFQVTVQAGNASSVQKAMDEGNFDLSLCAFDLGTIPNLAFLLSSTGKSNYQRYASSQMDSALHDAYYAKTADELKSAMSAVQMQVVEELPVLGLFFRSGVLISMQSLGGLTGSHEYDVLRNLATVTAN